MTAISKFTLTGVKWGGQDARKVLAPLTINIGQVKYPDFTKRLQAGKGA